MRLQVYYKTLKLNMNELPHYYEKIDIESESIKVGSVRQALKIMNELRARIPSSSFILKVFEPP